MNDIRKIINQIVFKHRTFINNTKYHDLYTTDDEGIVCLKPYGLYIFNYRNGPNPNDDYGYEGIYHFHKDLEIPLPKNY